MGRGLSPGGRTKLPIELPDVVVPFDDDSCRRAGVRPPDRTEAPSSDVRVELFAGRVGYERLSKAAEWPIPFCLESNISERDGKCWCIESVRDLPRIVGCCREWW